MKRKPSGCPWPWSYFIHNILTNSITKKKYVNVFQQQEIYIYYYMSKQYVGGVQKLEKVYLIRECKIVPWLYHSLTGSERKSLQFKEERQKKLRMGFWDCHVTSQEDHNGHVYSIRKMNIFSLQFYYFLWTFCQTLRESPWCNNQSATLRIRSKRVRISAALLRSLSDKHPWEKYELPYPTSYRLNSITGDLLNWWLWS